MFSITNMLSLSTKHVSKSTADLLNEQCLINASEFQRTDSGVAGRSVIHAGATTYGWIVYCHDDALEDYPQDLAGLMVWARKEHKCSWINLDCDGEEFDDLESYDW